MKKLLVGLPLFIGLLQFTVCAMAQTYTFPTPNGYVCNDWYARVEFPATGTVLGDLYDYSYIWFTIDSGRISGRAYATISNGKAYFQTGTVPYSQLTNGDHYFSWSDDSRHFWGPFKFTKIAPPVLTSISPNTATHGSAAFTLTVTGSFAVGPRTGVWWNQATFLVATFPSGAYRYSPTITVTVPASLLAKAGTASVQVVSETGNTGAISSAATFTIK